MDNGATSSGQGRGSRAGTKARPSEPIETQATEVVTTTEPDTGAAPANGSSNGKGTRGNGRAGRTKRAAGNGGMVGDPLAPAAEVTVVAGNGAADVAPAATATDEVAPVAAAEVPDDGGPPFTKGRPLGRFRARSPKAAGTAESALAAAAVAAAVAPPAAAPITAVPLAGPPTVPSPSTPVVTRVFEPPPTTPLIPVIVPVDPSGELVARKVTAPPTAVPLDVPVEPEPTITVPLGRRSGRPSVTFQRRRTRPRVRRVTRVVRHVDTWSVFKVAVVFSAFLYAVTLTAGVLLWHVAIATGTIDNVERFFEGFGWESFQFKGGEIFHNAWIAGLFVAVGLTGLAVLLATLFNLITDLVGGVRVSVLEEEVLARRDRTARMVVEDDPDAEAPYDQARSG